MLADMYIVTTTPIPELAAHVNALMAEVFRQRVLVANLVMAGAALLDTPELNAGPPSLEACALEAAMRAAGYEG